MIITCPNCSTQFKLSAGALGEAGRNVKCAKCAHRWFADPSTLAEEPKAAAPAAPAAAPPPPAPAPPPPAPPPPAPPPPAPPPPAPPPPAAPEDAEEPDEAEEVTEEEAAAPPSEEEAIDEEDEAESPLPIPSEEEIAQFQARPAERPSTLKWWIALFVVVVSLALSLYVFSRDIVAIYPPANKLFALLGMSGNVLGSGLEISDSKIETRLDGDVRVVTIKGGIKNTTGHVIDVPLLRGAVKDSKDKELRVWWFRTKEPRVLANESAIYETEIRNPPRGGVNVNITFTDPVEMEAEKARVKEAQTKK